MSPADGSLPVFYLADILLVLAIAGIAGWLGPRLGLSRWRFTRGAERRQVAIAPAQELDHSPPSLDYEDALCRATVADVRSRPWSFPEHSDPLTLKTQSDSQEVETRRAYLRLLQCYSKKPQSSVALPEQADVVASEEESRSN